MIARLWRGWTTPDTADAYVEHLRQATLLALGDIQGRHGAYVLRRDAGDAIEFHRPDALGIARAGAQIRWPRL